MNNQPNQLEILDSAMDLTDYCTKTLEMALDGEKDVDLYACTMNHVIEHLAKLKIDLVAAGAQTMDDEDTPAECPVEYEALYAMDKFMRESDADLPSHKRAGYVERLHEICDIRKSA